MDQRVDETCDSKCGGAVRRCAAPVARIELRQAVNRMLAAECDGGSGRLPIRDPLRNGEQPTSAEHEIGNCIHLEVAVAMLLAQERLGQPRPGDSFRVSAEIEAWRQLCSSHSERSCRR